MAIIGRDKHSARRRLTAISWAIIICLLVGGECLILSYVPLTQINQQKNQNQSSLTENPCGNVDLQKASGSRATLYYGCAVIFKNLIFVDAYHDTIGAISTLAVALFTFTLWQSTKALWEAGEDQLAHFEETSERQLRAYVFIDKTAFSFEPNSGAGSIVINIKNSGLTPAYFLAAKTEHDIREPIKKDEVLLFSEKARSFPGVAVGPAMPHCIHIPNVLTSLSDFTTYSDAGKRAYVWGRLDYVDAFGKDRYITFQMVHSFFPVHEFSYCERGNTTGETLESLGESKRKKENS